MHHPVKNIAPPTTQKGPDDVFFVVECQINDRTAPPPAIRNIALMSGGILCKGVVLKVHRVINYNSMYIIIGYDINTPLMTMYEIMTLCKHRMASGGKRGVREGGTGGCWTDRPRESRLARSRIARFVRSRGRVKSVMKRFWLTNMVKLAS